MWVGKYHNLSYTTLDLARTRTLPSVRPNVSHSLPDPAYFRKKLSVVIHCIGSVMISILAILFRTKNGMKMDKKKKRAAYIDRNNTLFQEFYHAHPRTKNKINRIYNNHFTDSPLWNLFCREAGMLCNSWNKSVRLMFDVPLSTHRYFLEPLAEMRQLKFTLIKRFLAAFPKLKIF